MLLWILDVVDEVVMPMWHPPWITHMQRRGAACIACIALHSDALSFPIEG